MANNDFFAKATRRAKKSMEKMFPGHKFNAYSFELLFRYRGIDFTKALLAQIHNGFGPTHDNSNKKKGNKNGRK